MPGIIDSVDPRELVFGGVLLLSNKLQVVGDKFLSDLTMKQWFLVTMVNLMTLERGKPTCTATEIANYTGTSRQNVRKMLDSLEKKGFVQLEPSKVDHRAVEVRLTDTCHRYFVENEARGQMFLDTLYDQVPAKELEITAKVFKKLLMQLQAMEGETKSE